MNKIAGLKVYLFLVFPHVSAFHGVSPSVNFLLINGPENGHAAIDFFLISFPGICIK